MSKLRVGIILLAALMVALSTAGPASAEFKDEKGGEEEVKVSGGSPSIKIGAGKVKCGKLKGSGFLAGKEGKTGEAASEDEPAAEPVKNSENIAVKLNFEECKAEIGSIKINATVKTEKCQFEINEDTDGEGKKASTSLVSLRTATAKEACKITITVTELIKCEIDVTAEHGNENEHLAELKTKNTKKFAGEIEAKSSVKGFEVASVSGGCGLTAGEITEAREGKSTELDFESSATVEGAEQQGPNITVSEGTMNFGKVVEATKAVVFKNNSLTDAWDPLGFGLFSRRDANRAGGPVSVWTVKDKCGGTTIPANGGTCTIEVKFNPVAGTKYKGVFREQGAPYVNLEGEG